MNVIIHVAGDLIAHQAPANLGTLLPGSIELRGEEILPETGPIKILADGTYLPAGSERTDHVAVVFTETGWMIHPYTLADGSDAFDNHEAATKACKELRVLGFENWDLAPREVWERHVLDLSRYNPAVDPTLFPGIRSGWHHTSTDYAPSKDEKSGVASAAWLVSSYGGDVSSYHRSGGGFGLAARRVGQ